MNKFLLNIVFFLCLSPLFGQEKINVLVVPFERINFHLNIDLNEVMLQNNFQNSNKVYTSFRDTLIKKICKHKGVFHFQMIPENELEIVKLKTAIEFKSSYAHYNGTNISRLLKGDFWKNMLKNLNAEYVLFINTYSINSVISTKGANFGDPFLPWASHRISYELFNSEGKIILLSDGLKLKTFEPNSLSFDSKGITLEYIKPHFKFLNKDIEKKFKKHKKKKKVIY